LDSVLEHSSPIVLDRTSAEALASPQMGSETVTVHERDFHRSGLLSKKRDQKVPNMRKLPVVATILKSYRFAADELPRILGPSALVVLVDVGFLYAVKIRLVRPPISVAYAPLVFVLYGILVTALCRLILIGDIRFHLELGKAELRFIGLGLLAFALIFAWAAIVF